MSQYYNPNRKRNLYNPTSAELFRLSRSKIDLFLNCPRCFYLDRKLGVGQPPGYPFSLNSAVDKLLKKEFDIHRANGTAHRNWYHEKSIAFLRKYNQIRQYLTQNSHFAKVFVNIVTD